jgi:phosphonate transport system substrate-binding protein
MTTRAVAAIAIFASSLAAAQAQESCPNRGQLDTLYCDAEQGPRRRRAERREANGAIPRRWCGPTRRSRIRRSTPTSSSRSPTIWKNASASAPSIIRCSPTPPRSRRCARAGLHFAGFSTGPTGFAVNLAGAVPFAAKGLGDEVRGYNLIAVVKAASPYQKLGDLKGKKVAHTSPSSNSGNLAPRVLFPVRG